MYIQNESTRNTCTYAQKVRKETTVGSTWNIILEILGFRLFLTLMRMVGWIPFCFMESMLCTGKTKISGLSWLHCAVILEKKWCDVYSSYWFLISLFLALTCNGKLISAEARCVCTCVCVSSHDTINAKNSRLSIDSAVNIF